MTKPPEPGKVRCPGCGRQQPIKNAKDPKDALYYCSVCKVQFDSDPDEGGSHYSDPSKRLEKSDQWQKRR